MWDTQCNMYQGLQGLGRSKNEHSGRDHHSIESRRGSKVLLLDLNKLSSDPCQAHFCFYYCQFGLNHLKRTSV